MSLDVTFPIDLTNGLVTTDLNTAFRCPVNRIAKQSSSEFLIPFEKMFKPADMTAGLPSSTTTGDAFLSRVGGTHGTATPTLKTADFTSASGTQGLRFTFELPHNYVAAGSVSLQVRAKWSASAPTVTNDLDARVFLMDGIGGITGSDKVQDAAQNPTGTAVTYEFDLSTTGLVAGNQLDCVVDVDVDQGAAAEAILVIGFVKMIVETQG